MWFFFQAVCEHLMSCYILYWPFCCSLPLSTWPGHVIQPERRLSVSTTSAHTLNKARRCCKPAVFRAHSHLPTSMFDLWITEAFLWLFVNPSCRNSTPTLRKPGDTVPVNTSYNKLTLGEKDLPRYAGLEQRVLLWMFIWRNAMPELCLTWGNLSGTLKACLKKNPYKSKARPKCIYFRFIYFAYAYFNMITAATIINYILFTLQYL